MFIKFGEEYININCIEKIVPEEVGTIEDSVWRLHLTSGAIKQIRWLDINKLRPFFRETIEEYQNLNLSLG